MIKEIELANIGYNAWNGFYLTILGIESNGNRFSGELVGLHITSDVVLISIFFLEFEIKLINKKNKKP